MKEEIAEREVHGEGVPILLINFIQALGCFLNYEFSGESPRSLTVAKIREQISAAANCRGERVWSLSSAS